MERRRRILLRLAEGTTPIPKIAREFGISKSAVHSLAERAVKHGLLDRLPGVWPATFRPGPNLLQKALMPHEPPDAPEGPSAAFTVRAHGLQASLPVLSLEGADMGPWTSWATKTGPMWKIDAGGLRMQLRGGTGKPVLVVSIPSLALEVTQEALADAEKRIREHVAEYVTLARKTVHEKYRIVAGGPARWYRKPEFAIERYPGVPEGVRYTVSFWVDSSMGPAEVESLSLETIGSLMAVGNRISRDLSMSTLERCP